MEAAAGNHDEEGTVVGRIFDWTACRDHGGGWSKWDLAPLRVRRILGSSGSVRVLGFRACEKTEILKEQEGSETRK